MESAPRRERAQQFVAAALRGSGVCLSVILQPYRSASKESSVILYMFCITKREIPAFAEVNLLKGKWLCGLAGKPGCLEGSVPYRMGYCS
jgi:hypothetical protein